MDEISADASLREAIENLRRQIGEVRSRRRVVVVTFALVAAAAVGLPVAALARPPSAPTVAGYLQAHVPQGSLIAVVPDVTARIPGTFRTVPITSVRGLAAAQPHWVVVGKGGDAATAWTVSHGVLALNTSTGRLYSVVPPAPPTMTRRPQSRLAAAPATHAKGSTVTVEPGDTFWGIAQRVAATRTGRTPSGPEVAALCRRLMDANARRLTDPGRPDLLYPGQVLEVPPP